MNPDGTPGLDEFNVRFFQTFWRIMRSNTSKMVLFILNRGFLLRATNETYIALIPKVLFRRVR